MMMDREHLEWRDPVTLKPHPANAAIYKDEPDEAMIDDVREVGVRSPIVIDTEDRIVSGHRRWRAAIVARERRVRVLVTPFADEGEVIEELIRQNRTRVKTYSQRAREGWVLEPRMQGRSPGRPRTEIPPEMAELSKATGETLRKTAAAIGMAHESYRQLRYVYSRSAEARRLRAYLNPDDAGREEEETVEAEEARRNLEARAADYLGMLDRREVSLQNAYEAMRQCVTTQGTIVPEHQIVAQPPAPEDEAIEEWRPPVEVAIVPAWAVPSWDEGDEQATEAREPSLAAQHLADSLLGSDEYRAHIRRARFARLVSALTAAIDCTAYVQSIADPFDIAALLSEHDRSNWHDFLIKIDAMRAYCAAIVGDDAAIAGGMRS